VVDGKLLQKGLGLLQALLFGKGLELQDGEEVLQGGHPPEGAGLLGQIPQAEPGPFVHGKGGDLLALKVDPPPRGPDEPHHHVEGGGLPRPVGAEEGHDLAPPKGEVHAPDHLLGAVALAQTLGAKLPVHCPLGYGATFSPG